MYNPLPSADMRIGSKTPPDSPVDKTYSRMILSYVGSSCLLQTALEEDLEQAL